MIKKIIGIIMTVALFVGSICGIVFGVKYHNVTAEDTQAQIIAQQESKISQLENQLKSLTAEKEKIISDNAISIEEKNEKIAELEAKQSALQEDLDKAKADYLNSYSVNYMIGYKDGYDYGYNVGQGNVDLLLSNYLTDNNLTLVKSFTNQTVSEGFFSTKELNTLSDMSALVDILHYVDSDSKNMYSLVIIDDTGISSFECIDFTKNESEEKVNTSTTNSSSYATYTLYQYSFTFVSEEYPITISYNYMPNINGNTYRPYVSGAVSSTTRECNYIRINGTVNMEDKIINCFLVMNSNTDNNV